MEGRGRAYPHPFPEELALSEVEGGEGVR